MAIKMDDLKVELARKGQHGVFMKASRAEFRGEPFQAIRELRSARHWYGDDKILEEAVRLLGIKKALGLASLRESYEPRDVLDYGLPRPGKRKRIPVDDLTKEEIFALATWEKKKKKRGRGYAGPKWKWPDDLFRLLEPLRRNKGRLEVAHEMRVAEEKPLTKGEIQRMVSDLKILESMRRKMKDSIGERDE